jgi:hypothetical protein
MPKTNEKVRPASVSRSMFVPGPDMGPGTNIDRDTETWAQEGPDMGPKWAH